MIDIGALGQREKVAIDWGYCSWKFGMKYERRANTNWAKPQQGGTFIAEEQQKSFLSSNRSGPLSSRGMIIRGC